MKTNLHLIIPLLSFTALPMFAAEAKSDEAKKEPQVRKEIRVITAPEGERGPGPRQIIRHIGGGEMETVTFLGVEASPVSPTLVAQLSLPEGSGLVVNQVLPKSPAASVLKPHDILLKIDDQILIEQRQLAVLVRNHKEGDEVTLTLLRGGKQVTAKVKLAKHEVPKMTMMFNQGGGPGALAERLAGGGNFDVQVFSQGNSHNGDEVNRVLSMIDAGGGLGQRRVQISRGDGPAEHRASVTVKAGSSRMVSDDDKGSLELTINDGKKYLVAKNVKGVEVFAGPVNTPEERQTMPEDVRARLEKIEDMKHFSFKTDGDFQGTETKIMRPPGQGISLPLRPVPVEQKRPMFF